MPRCEFKKRHISAVLLLAGVLACCDSSLIPEDGTDGGDNPGGHECPRPPAERERNYFPLELGDSSVYDYEKENRTTFSAERTVGSLSWVVVAATECAIGRQSLTLVEHFEGVRLSEVRTGHSSTEWRAMEQVNWDKSFSVTIGDSVLFDAHLFPALPRILPASAPDTLTFSNRDGRDAETIVLVQGVGVQSWSRSIHFVSASQAETQNLREVPAAEIVP